MDSPLVQIDRMAPVLAAEIDQLPAPDSKMSAAVVGAGAAGTTAVVSALHQSPHHHRIHLTVDLAKSAGISVLE